MFSSIWSSYIPKNVEIYHCVFGKFFFFSQVCHPGPTSTPLPWAKETPLTDWRSPQLARLTSSIVECRKQIVERRWTSIRQSIRAHLKKVMKLGKEWTFPWISNRKHMLHHKHRRAQFLQFFFWPPKVSNSHCTSDWASETSLLPTPKVPLAFFGYSDSSNGLRFGFWVEKRRPSQQSSQAEGEFSPPSQTSSSWFWSIAGSPTFDIRGKFE